MDILLTDLTDGSITTDTNGLYEWSGTGVLDVLVKAVNDNIKIQYDNGRIKGTDYAQVYLGLMQSVITESMKFLLQEKTQEKQYDVLAAQEELYKRQKAGFDDNKHQKILEAQLNAWGITFQDTDTTFIPTQLQQTEFDTSMAAVRTDYNV